jgi:hypothetical protein
MQEPGALRDVSVRSDTVSFKDESFMLVPEPDT